MQTKKKVLFSVIVPVYNVEKYLHQCVNSILGQTFSGFELILVDDGSSDDSPNICDQYGSADKRVTVIHQKNGGHTAARFKGLAIASGEYIFFVDSDDWIELNALELVHNSLAKNDADIVTFDNYYNYFDRQTIVRQSIPTGCFNKSDLMKKIYPRMIYSGNFFTYGVHASMANKVFRRSIIEPNMAYVDKRIKIGEDGVATFASFLDAEKVCNLKNKCLYHCRNDNVSVTRSYCRGQFDSAVVLVDVLRQVNSEKSVYDLSEQIDYYLLYHVRSVFVEEFYFKHSEGLLARYRLLKRVANDADVQRVCLATSIGDMPKTSKWFFGLLRKKHMILLMALSIYLATMTRLRSRR